MSQIHASNKDKIIVLLSSLAGILALLIAILNSLQYGWVVSCWSCFWSCLLPCLAPCLFLLFSCLSLLWLKKDGQLLPLCCCSQRLQSAITILFVIRLVVSCYHHVPGVEVVIIVFLWLVIWQALPTGSLRTFRRVFGKNYLIPDSCLIFPFSFSSRFVSIFQRFFSWIEILFGCSGSFLVRFFGCVCYLLLFELVFISILLICSHLHDEREFKKSFTYAVK